MAVPPLRPRAWTVAFVTAIVLFALRSALIVWFTATRVMNAGHFTYWNYVLGWMFYGFLIFVMLYSVPATHLYTLYVFPIVSASAFVVALLIVVILFTNDWLLIEESKLGHGDLTLGEIHAGDFLFHTWPLIEVCFLLMLGYNEILGQAYGPYVAGLSDGASVVFHVYWLLSPAPLLLIYAVLFDPMQVYPTPIPTVVALLLILVLLAVWFMILLAVASLNVEERWRRGKKVSDRRKADRPKKQNPRNPLAAIDLRQWQC